MRYEVNVGERVYESLKESLDYISSQLGSPMAAKALLDTFECTVDDLERFPYARPINHDASRELGFAVRRARINDYGLFYYVERGEGLVQAFSFLHSRQDVASHIGIDYKAFN